MDVLDTLPKGIPDDHDIPTLGWGLLAWALPLFVQPNGPRAGKPFRPTDRQVRFLLWWYALTPDGEFLYRHAVRRLAKGSGKSPFAAFLALCELLGPVRFDRWDDDVPGGAVGRSVGMALTQIAATSEKQTKNTMRMVRQFAAKERKLAKAYRLNTGKTQIAVMGTGAELEAMTASATGAEGAEPSCVIADEVEHWFPSNNGDDLYYTLDRNLAKSNSRMIETCNAWEPGIGSMAEVVWDAFVLQQEALERGEQVDGLILYDCVEAPMDVDLADEDSLIPALEAVYADCPWVNVRAIAETIWARTTPAEVSRRFYLNQRVANDSAWTTPQAWGAIADAAHVVPYGAEIVAFFDGSKTDDATALIGCEMESGHVFPLGIWEPRGTGGEVDMADVDREVRLMFDNYAVVAFWGDVAEWESFVKIAWAEEYGADLRVWSELNGMPPQPIAWDMRAHKRDFAEAAETVWSEIEQQKFTHDGSSVMTRHVLNMQRRPYQRWVSVGKGDHARKIDAGVCVIGARMLRQLVLSGNHATRKKKTGSFRAGRRW